MQAPRLHIDHVGLLGPDIERLVAEFRSLGFTVVGPAELTAIDDAGEHAGLGQCSAHVMFAADYIELTSVPDPQPGHHLEAFLSPPWGLRLLLPACDDIESARARCERDGLAPSAIHAASRQLTYRPGAEAHFRWFGLAPVERPEALLAFVEHLTPDLVFDGTVSQHANKALAITRLYYVGDSLPRHYELLGDGGPQTIEVIAPQHASCALGFDVAGTTPFAGLGIAVADVDATRSALQRRGKTTVDCDYGLAVQLQSGVCLIFEQAE
jgi:hypothetical protein